MLFLNKINIHLSRALSKPASSIQISASETKDDLFQAKKRGTRPWYDYGPKDNTPYYLEDLCNGSAVHNAILKTKSMMISGDGIIVNGVEYVDGNTNSELKYIVKNPVHSAGLMECKNTISEDYCINGAFAYLVTWNNDYTKIASYKPLLIKNLRPEVPEKGKKISKYYYYEGDFSKAHVGDVKEYYVYDQKDRRSFDQIVYEKDGYDIFGKPTYRGGIRWIDIDIEMGVFHESNIKNGMNPGLHFKFYTQPKTEEEKQSIIDQVKRTWMGAMNTGRFVPTFSPNKELATDVVPIETSNLDKQLLNLTELCDRKILSAHQLTSPLLAGISVSGQLGGNVELKTAYLLWSKTVIAKMMQKVDVSLQKHIFDINLKGTKIETKPFNPLEGIVL